MLRGSSLNSSLNRTESDLRAREHACEQCAPCAQGHRPQVEAIVEWHIEQVQDRIARLRFFERGLQPAKIRYTLVC